MELKEKTLLRLVTTGSVDDGKSTLIGRLLYETNAVYEDHLSAVEKSSRKKGCDEVDLALLMDGLAAEREQGITIDVAYRYFETPKRKFIIADSPGHEQYTRNMVTGASTAELAIILIDARNGVMTQSRRHGLLVSLLQVPHLVVAVNKMDLVDYSKAVYDAIVATYEAFSEKLAIHDISFIPVSALKGENVVEKSRRMAWYDGPSLLQHLERVHVTQDRNLIDTRFPVQYVIRPHQDFRGFAGRMLSGTLRPGEEIVVLPSGKGSRVKSIVTYDGELHEAFPPQSVTVTLEDEIDVSRGDMLVRKDNLPQVSNHLEAILCWMDDRADLSRETSYYLRHTTKTVRAFIKRIVYKIDVNSLHRESAATLTLNEIGRVELKTSLPLFFDPYTANRGTGSFVLIDPLSQNTVAAGMIRGAVRRIRDIAEHEHGTLTEERRRQKSPHTVWSGWNVAREAREARHGHKGAVLWLTGLSGSGKSTIAKRLEKELFERGVHTMLLDGDLLRHGLNGDLGFSPEDRSENIRRVGEVAKLFFEAGHVVVCTFISPFVRDRDFVRTLFPEDRFLEIFVKCDLEVCKRRDPNGLYQKALSGEIQEFTGISSPYEVPENPDLVVESDLQSVDDIIALLKERLRQQGLLGGIS
ncbi:bifunctional sulfate adenylyltransferase subunit 1/adenylylsulfate kinase [candidate division KSB3 bacterium]|uniref:Multifunctional fusion protein n=1 Tax=candidate division KSB3 bacterium TaxID=2044937 RepID=A0A2G6EE67_9BACT|nr:MAG: bifunctional sulfate adenylyltransferase subunit 1/adenylylsulfate kinase [candidate division KSB3 bacterium]